MRDPSKVVNLPIKSTTPLFSLQMKISFKRRGTLLRSSFLLSSSVLRRRKIERHGIHRGERTRSAWSAAWCEWRGRCNFPRRSFFPPPSAGPPGDKAIGQARPLPAAGADHECLRVQAFRGQGDALAVALLGGLLLFFFGLHGLPRCGIAEAPTAVLRRVRYARMTSSVNLVRELSRAFPQGAG